MIPNHPVTNDAIDGRPRGTASSIALLRCGVLLALLLIAFRGELGAIVGQAACFSEWSHAFSLPLVILLFCLCRRDDLRAAAGPGSFFGLLLIILGFLAWLGSKATLQFGYAQLLGMCAAAAGVVLATAGWRVFRICFPLFLIVWCALPLTERTMGSKTLSIQGASLMVAAELMDLAPMIEARPDGMTVAYECNDIRSAVGVAEQRFGASLLPACLLTGLFSIFYRRRRMAHVLFLLLLLLPIVLFANVMRIVIWGLVAAYGGFDVTSTIPRNVSLAASPLLTFIGILFIGWSLARIGGIYQQMTSAVGDDPDSGAEGASTSSGKGGA